MFQHLDNIALRLRLMFIARLKVLLSCEGDLQQNKEPLSSERLLLRAGVDVVKGHS